tara:strand:- start:11682 stop:12902 length:1221 start_codon:yes stop_codon:yes gene_type:complete
MARDIDKQDIPDGWQHILLDEITERRSGHTPSKSNPENWNGGIKWISLSDSFSLDKGYVYQTEKEISTEGIKNSSANILPAETVVLSRDAGIGKSGVMAEPMAVSQHFIAWVCDNSKKMNSWFLYNWLQTHKREFERQAVGSTIKTIGLPYFKKLEILAPPYQEQEKIAQILSTWDKAINVTKLRIENNHKYKKSLMQETLSGKTRFSEFRDKWKLVAIKDLLKESRVPSISNDVTKRITVRLNFKGVEARPVRGSEMVNSTAYFARKAGQFIYGKQNIHKGAFGIIPEQLDNFESSQDLPCFDFKENCDANWFFYKISQKSFYTSLENKMTGTGSKRLSPSEFFKLKIFVPKVEEQIRIASVLINADKETNLLTQQLFDLKKEKKALIQQLLTGKRRVKLEGKAA